MVFVFGTICIDRVRRVPKLPEPGGYIEIQDEQFLLGGEAANTANALTSWGRDVRLVGNSLGSGVEGELLVRLLSEKGLRAEIPLAEGHEPAQAPVCDIYVTPDGERTMFGKGFSHMAAAVDPERVPTLSGEWFTAEPNMGTVAREAVRRANAATMRIYLMDFVRADDPIFPGSYWQSSTDWAGVRNNTQKNVQWVKGWVAKYGCFAILSDGPNGFVAGSPDVPVRAYPPYPAPALVDSTGAGDLFRAGMLYGLEQGWDHVRCLQFASAAGCLKCQYLGATTVVPTVEQVLAHVGAHPEVSDRY